MTYLDTGIGEVSDPGISELFASVDHRHQLFSFAEDLELNSGYVNLTPGNPLRVYKAGDICFLMGTVIIPAAGTGNPTVATLPKEFAPTYYQLQRYVLHDPIGPGFYVGFMGIHTNGNIVFAEGASGIGITVNAHINFLYRMS